MTGMKGVIAAAATPIDTAGGIDLDHLAAHCAWLLGAGGCDGVNLLGTTGEATSFSVDQRIAAMRAVAAFGLPLGQLMVGTGAAALDDAIRLTAEAKALGFAGALLLPPFYYKGVSEDGIFAYVQNVIEAAGPDSLRLYLYHFPQNSGVPFTLDTVARLRNRYPEVLVGLKDSSGDLGYSAALAKHLPGFRVFPSAEGSIATAADSGFAGCISATANVTGRFASAAYRNPADTTALEKAVRLRTLICAYPLVASVKAALAMISGREAWNRLVPPLLPLSEEQRLALTVALAEAGLETTTP